MTKEAQALMHSLQSIATTLQTLDDNEKRCCGVTLAQCHALVEIGDQGSLSLRELAGKLGLDKSTLSRTVNNLVSQGYCLRQENPQDRRYVQIGLTAEGVRMYERVKLGMDRFYSDLYRAIPEEERSQVLRSAVLLLEAIRQAGCCYHP